MVAKPYIADEAHHIGPKAHSLAEQEVYLRTKGQSPDKGQPLTPFAKVLCRGRDSSYSAGRTRQPAVGLHIRRTNQHDQDCDRIGRAQDLIAEPFLQVGLVAVVRSILLLTAELKQIQSPKEAQSLLLQVEISTVLVGVLTIALYYARRMRLSEQKREISA